MVNRISVLLAWTAVMVVVGGGGYQSDATLGKRFHFGKSKLRNILRHIKDDWRKTKETALIKLKEDSQQDFNSNDIIQSSILTPEEMHSLMQQQRQNSYGCSCSDTHKCTTTCSIMSSTCGRTCTTLVIFKGHYCTYNGVELSFTTFDVYNTGCDSLSGACASKAITRLAAAAAAVAIAVGVAVPVGVGAINAAQVQTEQRQEVQQGVGQFLANGGLYDTRTPVNILPVPVVGLSLKDDGCGDISVRYRDGICYPVLRRGPCANPLHWITVDPINLLVTIKIYYRIMGKL